MTKLYQVRHTSSYNKAGSSAFPGEEMFGDSGDGASYAECLKAQKELIREYNDIHKGEEPEEGEPPFHVYTKKDFPIVEITAYEAVLTIPVKIYGINRKHAIENVDVTNMLYDLGNAQDGVAFIKLKSKSARKTK